MNASYSAESLTQTTDWPQGSRQAPSVPISVYRELATELKATQALVDSLTHQNQQLGQQNQLLCQEMLKFAESAAQLKQVVEARPLFTSEGNVLTAYPTAPSPLEVTPPLGMAESLEADLGTVNAETGGFSLEGVSHLTNQMTQMLKPKAKPPIKAAKSSAKASAKRPKPAPSPRMLYTEERLDPSRPGQLKERNTDLSGLWLATTIVLIVVSAFGAGFLIMKPLLSNSR